MRDNDAGVTHLAIRPGGAGVLATAVAEGAAPVLGVRPLPQKTRPRHLRRGRAEAREIVAVFR